MKRILTLGVFAGLFAMMMVSCGNKSNQHADSDETEVQTGDLLFVGLPYDYDLYDSTSTDRPVVSDTRDENDTVNYIHVAILERDENDRLWIVDATLRRGVDRYPLDTFLLNFTLNDGTLPQLDVMRLKDNADAAAYVANARQFCGHPYDICFGASTDSLYCSELVRDAYVSASGEHVFSEAPISFKSSDGSFPLYWQQLFGLMKQPIPQDKMGTTPSAMIKESCLKYVGPLKVNR